MLVPTTATTGGLVNRGFKGTITGSGQLMPTLLLPEFVTASSEVLSSYSRGLQ